jgi:hypothetical protein
MLLLLFDTISHSQSKKHYRRNQMESKPKITRSKINDFLDRHVLPWPVRFLTARFVILMTIILLLPLIIFAKYTVFVLATNSYLNTMSVAVSSIVLLYATISEARQKQIAEMQEKRALEDHIHVTEMHNLIMRSLQNQTEEMEELKQLITTLTGKKYVASKQTECQELKAIHPRGVERFSEENVSQRLESSLHQNELVTVIRKDLLPK